SMLGAAGFVMCIMLLKLTARGSISIAIAVIAAAGILLGYGHAPRAVVALPVSIAPIALKLDILGVLRLSFLPILLTLFVMSFLDTLGTLVGLGAAAEIDDLKKPMLVDAVACV